MTLSECFENCLEGFNTDLKMSIIINLHSILKKKDYMYRQKCSKSEKLALLDHLLHTLTIRAPVGVKKNYNLLDNIDCLYII